MKWAEKRPGCENPIGPSMPCAHLDCTPGEFLHMLVPFAEPIRFARRAFRTKDNAWFEWERIDGP